MVAAPGAMFTVDATFRTGEGGNPGAVPATAYILYDDFFLAGTADAVTGADGAVRFQFAPGVATMGKGNRFLHITAGPAYPLVEKILAL